MVCIFSPPANRFPLIGSLSPPPFVGHTRWAWHLKIQLFLQLPAWCELGAACTQIKYPPLIVLPQQLYLYTIH